MFARSWSSSSVTMLTVSCALAGLMLTLVKSPYEIGRKGNHSDTELAQSVARLRRANIEEVEREVQSLLTEIEKEKEHVSFTERMKNIVARPHISTKYRKTLLPTKVAIQ